MAENNKKEWMASRWTVAIYAVFGLLLVGSGIGLKLYLGSWGNIVLVTIIVFVAVWSVFLFHLVRYPIIIFNDDGIEIPRFILLSSRIISFRDIQGIRKTFAHEAEIVLIDGKRVHLPISLMKNSDCEHVISEINKKRKEADASLHSAS